MILSKSLMMHVSFWKKLTASPHFIIKMALPFLMIQHNETRRLDRK
jgi:hypothetical protein